MNDEEFLFAFKKNWRKFVKLAKSPNHLNACWPANLSSFSPLSSRLHVVLDIQGAPFSLLIKN